VTVLARSLRQQVARAVRETRLSFGWTQRDLAHRAHVSQSTICRIELGSVERLTIETAARVLGTLGIRAGLDLRPPFVAGDRRQRDAGHARCLGFVARRLERAGWIVRFEAEVAAGSARGWIDILAFRAADRTLLVVEVKTELVDIGGALRQLAWYESQAWAAARRLGWRPARREVALLLLASAPNAARLRDNRTLLGPAFPGSVAALTRSLAGNAAASMSRTIAFIDPLDRGRRWLLPSALVGKPPVARYTDYADFMRHATARRTTGRSAA
jgi:transcriptional regulator with XRE-family HTH domain